MRKFYRTCFALALTAGVVAMGACSDSGDDKKPVPEPDDGYTVFNHAAGIYFSDDIAEGVGHYSVVLYTDGLTFTDSWGFEGTGEFIWLEMYGAMAPDLRSVKLAPGSYGPVASEEEIAQGVFLANGQADMYSFYGRCTDGNEEEDPIAAGEVTVTQSGDATLVRVNVTTDSGLTKTVKFEGALPFELFGIGYPPEPFAGTFHVAVAEYYGDYYKKGSGNLQLILSDAENLPRHQLILDLNGSIFASQHDIEVETGTYPAALSYAPMTFNRGTIDQDGYYNGSLWVTSDSAGNELAEIVESGSVVVSLAGGKYTVRAEVTLDGGERIEGTYEGPIAVSDQTCYSRIDGDVQVNATQGVAVFYGEAQYNQNNSYNWLLLLAEPGIDFETMTGTGEMIQLEINTSKESTTEIPSGTYEVMEKIQTDYLVPLTFIPGYYDTLRDGLVGVWYSRDLQALAPGVGGNIVIVNRGGGSYDIRFNLLDDYYYTQPHNITGDFYGKLAYVDGTAADPQKAHRTKAPARTHAFRPRQGAAMR